MSTITKELAKLFRKITNSEIDAEGNAHVVLSPADSLLINNARIALASLEAEPVAWLLSGGGAKNHVSFDSSNAYADPLREVTPLYAAPQLPQPAVVDEHYQHLNELYHAQEKRLFKIAQRIKGPSFDKYAYSPSQAIDVLESGIFGERECDGRSAMLQGAEQQSPQQNIPENIPTLRDGLAAIRSLGGIDAGKIQAERDALNEPTCWCRTCRPVTMTDMRFVVCPECGNKRCPHANDHRNVCSGSNEPGQEGSAYPAAPQQEVK
ncbi:hypothetical protein [Citrobacter freundii]|uniref:hypothetical protein n=1 Tax=Citrobacter freundii TaxID=546 RepID=UPI00397B6CA5